MKSDSVVGSDACASENGIIFLGPWSPELERLVGGRWMQARFGRLDQILTRIDLSGTPRGSCPGFNDEELLALLSQLVPGTSAIGFFCDSVRGAEGVRIFEQGKQRERHFVEWKQAPTPDPIAWPISMLAMSLRLPLEAVTRVARPERPPIAVAVQALMEGGEPQTKELLHQALEILGQIPVKESTQVLIRYLQAEEWVDRFHAARGYCRLDRGFGEDGHPRLESLLEDEDESVREAALRGMGELLPEVEFAKVELHKQIDRAVELGLKDEDEDVREVAGQVRALRTKLLG